MTFNDSDLPAWHDVPFTVVCLCGAVRCTGRGLRDAVMCHCGQCCKGHGGPAAYSATRNTDLQLDELANLQWYRASENARRGFCAICGSNLFWEKTNSTTVAIAASAIVETHLPLNLACHIFVADKPVYDEIHDTLPQFEGSMNLTAGLSP